MPAGRFTNVSCEYYIWDKHVVLSFVVCVFFYVNEMMRHYCDVQGSLKNDNLPTLFKYTDPWAVELTLYTSHFPRLASTTTTATTMAIQ